MATKRDYVNRLNKWADFLEQPAFSEVCGKFNMGTWGNDFDNGKPVCGTAACAGGWATAIPSFRKAGFRMNQNGNVMYNGEIHSKAIALFFGLNDYDAVDLVYGCFGTTRRSVATSIRKLAKKL